MTVQIVDNDRPAGGPDGPAQKIGQGVIVEMMTNQGGGNHVYGIFAMLNRRLPDVLNARLGSGRRV